MVEGGFLTSPQCGKASTETCSTYGGLSKENLSFWAAPSSNFNIFFYVTSIQPSASKYQRGARDTGFPD